VAGVKLPMIDKRHGQIILPDDAGRLSLTYDPAEDTTLTHESLTQSDG
jgi:hypothetical protein